MRREDRGMRPRPPTRVIPPTRALLKTRVNPRALVPTRVILLTAALVSAACILPAFARGRDDNRPASAAPSLSVLAPQSAYPGDCAVVILEYGDGRSSSEATGETRVEAALRDETGATRARAAAFALDGSRREAAILALPPGMTPGNYRLIVASVSADGTVILSDTPCAVEAREFVSETVRLDAANTAIKKDASAERMAQIEELNGILFRQDAGAVRFAGPYAAPLQSSRRTSQYGERRTYAYSNGSAERTTHLGIDFGIPTGSPVYAAGDGRVVLAKSRVTTGWTVVIEHFPGVYSLYYHLDSLSCGAGETVRTGTLIGKSGSTGLSTGPHLHWEFRVNGEAVSPDWFVGRVLF